MRLIRLLIPLLVLVFSVTATLADTNVSFTDDTTDGMLVPSPFAPLQQHRTNLHTFTVDAIGTYTIDATCNFDTVLALYDHEVNTGSVVDLQSFIMASACTLAGGESVQVSGFLYPGVTYHLYVSGFTPLEFGEYTLDFSGPGSISPNFDADADPGTLALSIARQIAAGNAPATTFEVCLTGPSYPTTDTTGRCQTGDSPTWNDLIPGEYTLNLLPISDLWIAPDIDTPVLVTPGNITESVLDVIYVPPQPALAQSCVSLSALANLTNPVVDGLSLNGLIGLTTAGGQAQIVQFGQPPVAWESPATPFNFSMSDYAIYDPTGGNTFNFDFADIIQVTEFSVRVYDWGDENPTDNNAWALQLTSPGTDNADGLTFTSDTLPEAGDSYLAMPGQPGNRRYAISGDDLETATLTMNNDPRAGIDELCITYTFRTGDLEVIKNVDWNGAPVDTSETFEICVSGPSLTGATPSDVRCQTVGANGGTLSWENLTPGDYMVMETPPGNAWSYPQTAQVISVRSGQTSQLAITNRLRLGTLRVTKVVDWQGLPVNQAVSFEICITGASFPEGTEDPARCQRIGGDGGTLIWRDLIPGSYTVLETLPGGDWQVTQPDAPAVVPAGGTGAATVTNQISPATIQATVNVNWNGQPVNNGQGFSVCIYREGMPGADCQSTGSGGGVLTWSGLTPSTYNVYQLDPGANWSVTGGGSIMANAGLIAQTTFNNTHNAPPPPTCVHDLRTDLSGFITGNNTGQVTNNGTETCTYEIGLASYSKFDDNIDTQVIHDYVVTSVSIAPGQTVTIGPIGLPSCDAQVDLFYGGVIQPMFNGARYGDRLLAAVHTGGAFCTP